jgi:hypothetical protein
MNYTHHELERISYITGTGQAPLYAELDTAELREEAMSDACTYIQEAKSGMPDEDFLQGLIDQCRAMAKGRVTKADVLAFCVELEDLQDEVARSSEHGLEQLAKAEKELGG